MIRKQKQYLNEESLQLKSTRVTGGFNVTLDI